MSAKQNPCSGIIFLIVVLGLLCACSNAETISVDSKNGDDINPGTEQKPVKTIARAAAMVNNNKEPGPTVIKIQPGVYVEDKPVVFDSKRPYTKQKRLTIEAAVLPDELKWKPTLMPIVLFTNEGQGNKNEKHAPGLMMELNHVTVRGLKFLGDPRPRTCTYPIYRWGKNFKDFLITQCLFIGDREAMPYNCSICANGHGLVVDHCVFYNCEIPVIFWNAEGGISRGNAMRYCIVDGADIAAVWVCQTAEDFEFHHNVITRSKYVWMRSPNNHKTYKLNDCIITENMNYSGYGTAKELLGQTGPEAKYIESNIIKKGKVILQKDPIPSNMSSVDMPRDYLNIADGTLGRDLGAGLFKKEGKAKVKMQKTKNIEEGFISTKNAQLYYKTMGQGEPIIIVHGGPGLDHIHMLPFKKLASDYKVIFYDQRATGNSTGSLDSNSITVDNFVEDLEALRKELKVGKINIIGHSWGAALAAFYSIKYPQNLKTLILLGASASSDYLDQYFKNIQKNTIQADRLALKQIAQSQSFKEKQVEAVQNYFQIAVKPLFHNPSLAEILDLTFVEKTAKNQNQINQLLFEETRNFNIYDELSVVKCPTLIIHGESDPLPVEAPRKIHQHIPQSRFVILKQAGHFMFIESPGELFSIIRNFLKDIK